MNSEKSKETVHMYYVKVGPSFPAQINALKILAKHR